MDIRDIIEAAGGAEKIAASIDRSVKLVVNKWPKIGIPDRHWPTIIKLARKAVTPEQIYKANIAARRAAQERVAP